MDGLREANRKIWPENRWTETRRFFNTENWEIDSVLWIQLHFKFYNDINMYCSWCTQKNLLKLNLLKIQGKKDTTPWLWHRFIYRCLLSGSKKNTTNSQFTTWYITINVSLRLSSISFSNSTYALYCIHYKDNNVRFTITILPFV